MEFDQSVYNKHLRSVSDSWENLRHVPIEYQDFKMCAKAIKQSVYALQLVKIKDPRINTYAVVTDPYALEFVEDQTEELCMSAVNRDGRCLQFVKNQTPEICCKAIYRHYSSIDYVKDLSSIATYITNGHIDDCISGGSSSETSSRYKELKEIKSRMKMEDKALKKLNDDPVETRPNKMSI